jgi:hypothetical protein
MLKEMDRPSHKRTRIVMAVVFVFAVIISLIMRRHWSTDTSLASMQPVPTMPAPTEVPLFTVTRDDTGRMRFDSPEIAFTYPAGWKVENLTGRMHDANIEMSVELSNSTRPTEKVRLYVMQASMDVPVTIETVVQSLTGFPLQAKKSLVLGEKTFPSGLGTGQGTSGWYTFVKKDRRTAAVFLSLDTKKELSSSDEAAIISSISLK